MHNHELDGAADADRDGLADAFDSDNDNDGSSDSDELIAGTNPVDSSDALRITGIRRTASGVHVTWSARSGRAYRVVRSAAPGSDAPSREAELTIDARLRSEPAPVEYLDRDAPPTAFYRIEVAP